MGRARGSAVAVGRPIALELSSGAAMGQKSLRDLLRGLSVLTLCSSPHFLRFAPWILEGSRRLLGRHLWVAALRASFYGHFVGGETPAEVKAAVGQLRAMGLRALLALPCEEQRRGRPTGEEWFEANCGAALQCVGLTAAMGQEPMMQLKVTALMSAQLCEILSKPNSGLTMEVVEAMMDGEERPLPGLSAAQNEHLRAAVGRLQRVTEGCGSRLWADSEWLRRRGALFGAKLVRGAYVEEEKGGENLQPSLEWTHRSFGRCVELALALALRSRLRGAVMVATHNEDSVRHTARRMEELGIPRSGGGVCFGQLYGMGDHISLALGDAGFTVYKSVPYGPPEATIAYLVRRAQENHAAFSGAGKEAKLMARELWRRLQPWRR
ncbi:hydroxyproline dehydrogenase isoform X2 [Cuculus canorus]|uniref:hydroxyproline dehydrogenase isoform X2 n=1 Tax=Cuculus canorus TaxID=55661 RepID=UPI0023AA39AF|nr:hydroxyproline dehydrogenase isoform X2 [Cuculus canorus]